MHPASRILIYLIAALVIPGLSFFWGGILLFVAILFLVHANHTTGHDPRRSSWQLLWRVRWLFLVMFLGYGYSVPGAQIWQVLGDWSPSVEGLELGAQRVFQLMVLLLWLDWLVLRLSAEDLLTGLFALMSPLRVLKLDVTRAALRLALTLKAVEQMERSTLPGTGHLPRLFSSEPDPQLPTSVQFRQRRASRLDVLFPVIVLTGATWLWLYGGAG